MNRARMALETETQREEARSRDGSRDGRAEMPLAIVIPR
jgi:hypothetical protein